MGCRRLFAFALVAALAAPAAAANTTRELLDAPRIHHALRLRIDGRRVLYRLDEGTLEQPLTAGMLFVAPADSVVTIQPFNPLTMRVSAALAASVDPAMADIADLLKALLKLPVIIAPIRAGIAARPPPAAGCAALQDAYTLIDALESTLYPPEAGQLALARDVAEWTEAIDRAPGPPGVTAARDAILVARRRFTPLVARAQAGIDELLARSASPPDGADACAAAARALYETVRLTNPAARLSELRALQRTLSQLAAALARLNDDSNWDKGGYIVAALKLQAGRMLDVQIEAAAIGYEVEDGVMAATSGTAARAHFSVRRFTRFAIEAGAGATLAFVDRPSYGTGRNARGETVVTTAAVDRVSVDPSVLVNFVCRCGRRAFFVEPMAQIGASTSKQTPAIFLGGGIRLFGIGSGDVAFGGGAVLAWVRDLTALSPGDVVTGSAAIDADLSLRHAPRVGRYLVLQYKW